MNRVEPEELSALLDGELERERERAIRAQLAVDSSLAAELDALRRLDRRARTAATTAAFDPGVHLPVAQPSKRPFVGLVSVVVALLVVRVMSRVLDASLVTWALNAAALIAVLAASYGLLRATARQDEAGVNGEGAV